MKQLFISDIHLSPERPELTLMITEFLYQQQGKISELYILGDIFNTWLGDDLVPSEFTPFVEALHQLSANGVRIYLMVGNRDFMLGKQFAASVGATLLTDPYLIKVAGKKCLLMHGDSLCIDDVSYQRYRKWVRNRLLQWCFLNLPVAFRQKISDKIKQKSRQQKQHKSAMIMDANQAEISQVMTQYGVNLLIHGHTHRPAIHQLQLSGNQAAQRVVLGDWQDENSYAVADDQQISLYDHRLEQGISQLRLT